MNEQLFTWGSFSLFLLLLCSHHLQKFCVIYHAISIVINFLDHLVHLIICKGLILRLQALFQLVGANSSWVVLVEVLECLLDLFFFSVVLRVHACSDKFGVVDYAIIVGINNFHCLLNVIHRQFNLWHCLNTFQQLLMCQLTISIFVELCKYSSQLRNLAFWDSGGDVSKCALPQLGLPYIVLHIANNLWI